MAMKGCYCSTHAPCRSLIFFRSRGDGCGLSTVASVLPWKDTIWAFLSFPVPGKHRKMSHLFGGQLDCWSFKGPKLMVPKALKLPLPPWLVWHKPGGAQIWWYCL